MMPGAAQATEAERIDAGRGAGDRDRAEKAKQAEGESEIYSRVVCGTLSGLAAEKVFVEANVTSGFPSFHIVGLADTAIKESKERVRAAISNAGAAFPQQRVIVNLSPADIRKEGTHFDLPVAVSILAAGVGTGRRPAGQYRVEKGSVFFGELSLDGSVVAIRGMLPLLIGLRSAGMKKFFIPAGNLREASVVSGIRIYPVDDLRSLLDHLGGKKGIAPIDTGSGDEVRKRWNEWENEDEEPLDFSDVEGQEEAKRALQIAAAAMHNILLSGSPGSGKSMLVRRLPGILPPLTYDERIELTKIYSVCGMLDEEKPVITRRPFRAPDTKITPAALTGGGRIPKPGEVSLAHLGVLFLDELPEYPRRSLEALRNPMEDERTSVSRTGGRVLFPSKFLTAAAMNPCPCGYLGDPRRKCVCTESEIRRYRAKLSGPFLDRMDLFVAVNSPDPARFASASAAAHGGSSVSTAELRVGVLRARNAQEKRFSGEKISYNSQMTPRHLKRYCALSPGSEALLRTAYRRMALSVRACHRILRVARTIADLEEAEHIEEMHIAEAIRYKEPVTENMAENMAENKEK